MLVTNRIGEEKLIFRSTMVKYFVSSILAITCGNMGQIVGNIIIGNSVGEDKLAIMSLVLPIYYVFATIGNLTGIGGSALCAKLIGKGRVEDCKKAYTATYIITVGMCVTFSVIFIAFLPKIVYLLGSSRALYDDVYKYSFVMILGGVFTAGVYLSFNFLRLDGKAIATTLTFVIMGVINIAFDFILTSVVDLGVLGISIATSMGAAAATVFGPIMISVNSDQLGFKKLSVSELKKFTKSIFEIGSPGATENISILFKNYFLNLIVVAFIGTAALSSLSVLNSINTFATAIIVGCAGTLVPFVGVFSSERDYTGIRRTMESTCFACCIMILIFCGFVFGFAPFVSKLFGVRSVAGVEMTTTAIRYFCVSLFLSIFTNMLIYLHLSNNHTVLSNIITVMRNFAFLILAALVLLKYIGQDGLGLAFLVCEACTLLAAVIMHGIVVLKDKSLTFTLLLPKEDQNKYQYIAICTLDTEEEIAGALDAISEFCASAEIERKQKMLINLSMDEMLHSIAEHSTKDSKIHLISTRILVRDGVIVMRIRYNGKKFNPIDYYESKKKSGDNTLEDMLDLDDSMGIKMIIDVCEVVDYRTTFGLNNLMMLL